MTNASRSTSTPVLRLRDVSKAYGATQALDRVSFDVRGGAIHALVGENGSGKSTLIKVLAGVVQADAGSVEVKGAAHDATSLSPAWSREEGLRFVHQQNSTFPDMTVAENLAIGHGFERGFGGRIKWGAVVGHARGVLERFGIDASPKAYVRDLGPATQMMVAIARALQGQSNSSAGILVLDEPTASLPKNEVDFLLDAMRRYATAGQTVVCVTHRLEEVVAVADRATVLRDGKVAGTVERDDLDHGTLVQLMVGRSLVPQVERSAPPAARGDGRPAVLEARGLGWENDMDVRLLPGEIVGVAGLLGSGRSGLLRSLFGASGPATVMIDGVARQLNSPGDARNAGIVYVPENRGDAVFADLTVSENMSIADLDRYSHLGHINRRAEKAGATEAMDRFMVRAASLGSSITSLSGGNQQKVVLARWLRRDPRVLLLDEPSQGVDVGARAEIHSLIRRTVDQGAAALVVSSDAEELTTISDRIIVLREGRQVGELAGDEINDSNLDSLVYAVRRAAA